jgi:hypothetical protein
MFTILRLKISANAQPWKHGPDDVIDAALPVMWRSNRRWRETFSGKFVDQVVEEELAKIAESTFRVIFKNYKKHTFKIQFFNVILAPRYSAKQHSA